MSWRRLVCAHGRGNKLCTLLMLGSYAVAFFLFCVPVAVRHAFYQGVEVAGRIPWSQRLPSRLTVFPGVGEFNVRALYRGGGERERDDTTEFWFHQKHLGARARSSFRGLVGFYPVKVRKPEDAARLRKPWMLAWPTPRGKAAPSQNGPLPLRS